MAGKVDTFSTVHFPKGYSRHDASGIGSCVNPKHFASGSVELKRLSLPADGVPMHGDMFTRVSLNLPAPIQHLWILFF